jgi:Glycosyl transferases group 1
MRVVLFGHQQFVRPLRAAGHQVIDAFTQFPQHCRPGHPFDAAAIWPHVGTADAVLVTDMLGPQALPYGFERLPVPCGYYAIDTHVNWFWQRHYAQLFDRVFAAQRDYVPLFTAEGVPTEWAPWGADAAVFVDRGQPRTNDLVFVGTDDPARRPKRAALLAHLRDRFGLRTFGADPAQRLSWEDLAGVYGGTKIVINEALCGDLTFRVFEAMACGALLLTERAPDGVEDLFTAGVHLDAFDPSTIDAVVSRYLTDDTLRTRIAQAGCQLVHTHHRLDQRMARMIAATASAARRSHSPVATARAWATAGHLLAVRGLMDVNTTLPIATTLLHRAYAAEPRADVLITLAETCVLLEQCDHALALCAEARRIGTRSAARLALGGAVARPPRRGPSGNGARPRGTSSRGHFPGGAGRSGRRTAGRSHRRGLVDGARPGGGSDGHAHPAGFGFTAPCRCRPHGVRLRRARGRTRSESSRGRRVGGRGFRGRRPARPGVDLSRPRGEHRSG